MIPEFDKLSQTGKELFTHFFMREVTGQGPIRFNELLRELNKNELHISRPTLAENLKTLTENEFVTRIEINKQNVQYEYNKKLVEYLDYNKRIKHFKELLNTRKEFDKLTPVNQTVNIFRITLLHEIQNLILSVKIIHEPEKRHQYFIQMKTGDAVRDWHKKWLLENCMKNDADFQNQILESLENMFSMISKDN